MLLVSDPRAVERLAWATPGLGPDALGLDSMRELFEPSAALSPRLERLERSATREHVRFPLPGTPDARGNLSGRPGPLGTGWLWLSVHRGGLGALVRARCTHPRSASLAEREWNLYCHLRERGVGTPEPLLVGARGAGLVSMRSFLLVRAPVDAFPLPRWLRTDGHGAARARGLEALGRALALLLASGVEFARLSAEHLWITPSGSGECETEDRGGLRKNKLPGVTLVDVRGARFGTRPSVRRRRLDELLTELAAVCTPAERAHIERLALRQSFA